MSDIDREAFEEWMMNDGYGDDKLWSEHWPTWQACSVYKQKPIDDADICIRALYRVLKEASERCGVENNQFIPSQIVGAMFSAEQWMQGKYGHFEDIKAEYDARLDKIIAHETRIEELEDEISELKEETKELTRLAYHG